MILPRVASEIHYFVLLALVGLPIWAATAVHQSVPLVAVSFILPTFSEIWSCRNECNVLLLYCVPSANLPLLSIVLRPVRSKPRPVETTFGQAQIHEVPMTPT